MKLTLFLLPLTALAALAATEEQLNKHFTVQPEGKLVVDVDFGSIDVTTHATDEVVVDVWRKITRKNKADEVHTSGGGKSVVLRSSAESIHLMKP